MEELIFTLMSKFTRRDKLYANIDDLSTVKGIKELLDVDISLKRSHSSSKFIGVGTIYYYFFFLLDETGPGIDTTDHLIQNLPFNESLTQYT